MEYFRLLLILFTVNCDFSDLVQFDFQIIDHQLSVDKDMDQL